MKFVCQISVDNFGFPEFEQVGKIHLGSCQRAMMRRKPDPKVCAMCFPHWKRRHRGKLTPDQKTISVEYEIDRASHHAFLRYNAGSHENDPEAKKIELYKHVHHQKDISPV